MKDCITDSLAVYQPSSDKPWNKRRAQHLFYKLGIAASLPDIHWALSRTPEQAVDALIDASMNEPVPQKTDYPFGDPEHDPWQFSYPDPNGSVDANGDPKLIWPNAINSKAMIDHFYINSIEGNGLKYKLLLFWTNHFVIEAGNILQYQASWLYMYLTQIHTHAFGDFLEMTKAIGLTPAMLHYLNGNRSFKNAPNENYARELLELFTMGPDEYTQHDIDEIARLMTGWRAEPLPWGDNANSNYPDQLNPLYPAELNAHLFDPNLHDWGTKTILGKTYTPDAQTKDVAFQEYLWLHHEVLFKERKNEIAEFICSKIYRFFVYHEPNSMVVAAMAATFKNNDWRIEPVLRQLFKSEHFFEQELIGSGIKSPIDFLCGFLRQANFKIDVDYFRESEGDPNISYFQFQLHRIYYDGIESLGQHLFSPVNVAGWPGGKTWITENTLTKRWSTLRPKITYFKNLEHLPITFEKFRQLAKDLTENYSSSDDFDKPEIIVKAIAEHFILVDLSPETLAAAVEVFKGEIPDSYYDQGGWDLNTDSQLRVPVQVIDLLLFLTELPEYQLN